MGKSLKCSPSQELYGQVIPFPTQSTLFQSLPQKSLLVVNENDSLSQEIKRSLEGQKHHVWIAKNAMELCSIIEHQKIDLLIVDVALPWLDGYELCSLIKSDSAFKDLPITLTSGSPAPEDVRRGIASGCDDYLVGPLALETLHKSVDTLLARTGSSWNHHRREEPSS